MSNVRRNISWRVRLALLACSIAFSVVAVEVMVRAVGLDRPLVWQPDPILGWWHVPGATQRWTEEGDGWIEINAQGMRDVPRATTRTSGLLRVAIFGDSMTEGVQVQPDQTYAHVLERRLAQRLGRPVEVLNFGVNGYSPLQEYLLFREKGVAFTPDLVIHAVFLDNDVADLDPALASGQRGAPTLLNVSNGELRVDYTPAAASATSYAEEPLATMRRWSATYRMASAARYRRLENVRFETGRAEQSGIPRRYLLYATPARPEWEAAWGKLEGVIRAFSRAAADANSSYLLLSVPAGQVVNPEAWDNIRRQFPETAALEWNLHGPEGRLAEIASRASVPLVSVLEDYTKAPGRRSMFYGLAGHFTPQGHDLMAALLEAAIARHPVVSGDAPPHTTVETPAKEHSK